MDKELFPAEAVAMDSPRLAWMKENRVLTYRSSVEPVCWYAAFDFADWSESKDTCDYFAKETVEYGDSRIGIGETEDDALLMLCQKHRVKLWNEESP